MKTIETTIEVDDRRRVTIQLPEALAPGPYQAVLVIGEPAAPPVQPSMADFPRHDIPWPFPEGFTLRREDIYDDSGRGA